MSMHVEEALDPQADGAAVAWARARFAVHDAECIGQAPWARTHRLTGPSGVAYLKIVPLHQKRQLQRTALVAQRLPEHVPHVLAIDSDHGWMLSRTHGGRDLGYDASGADLAAVAVAYARLQARAAAWNDVQGRFRTVRAADQPGLLLDFLARQTNTPQGRVPVAVGADYFLGQEDAQRYHRLLERRLALLNPHIASASELPDTLAHGDLRPPNVALLDDGQCVLMDWDDVAVGPAGLCLHGLFEGCTLPSILLARLASRQALPPSDTARLITAYLDTLAASGYATRERLMQGLPGAMCAGQMRFIVTFGRFPGESGRSDSADTLRSRLGDLLDLCDWLATRQPETTLEYARDYAEQGEAPRAQRLYQDLVARQPERIDLLGRYGAASRAAGALAVAEEAFSEAIERQPDHAEWHLGLARTRLDALDLDGGERAASEALRLAPQSDAARATLARARTLQRVRATAGRADGFPRLGLNADEQARQRLDADTLALAAELFQAHGVLQIDHLFPAERVQALQQTFATLYADQFHAGDHPDALQLGHKRYMLTVDMDRVEGAAALAASEQLLPMVQAILGEDCVLGAYTAAVSLPGSRDQRLHKDHPPLFPDTEWHHTLPSFALQLMVPLVPLTALNGTTRVYKGTHRVHSDEAEQQAFHDPLLPLGSGLLLDYRCLHRGLANRSEQVRPILTLVFNRPWFRDTRNYGQQPPLRFSTALLDAAPRRLRALLKWWEDERRIATQPSAD
jgi:ectoine hydroxylase-related dioxygenase (phytanoyl-CoA dioxygenase family)